MINVVKIGGPIIDDPAALQGVLKQFASLAGRKILVHGGGKEATRLARALDVSTEMIDGRRVTGREMLDVCVMVYAGAANKRIVSLLQGLYVDAIGLSGVDGDAVRAVRRPVTEQGVDYGYVGDIDAGDVNTRLLSVLLDAGLTPVICAIAHDGHGGMLNCNADGVARAVAVALTRMEQRVRLTYCIDHPGVMADVADPASVIPVVSRGEVPAMLEKGVLSAGMLPKIQYALDAARQGVDEVRITSAEGLTSARGTIVTR